MKYLHIFFSDNKFLDPTILQFEKVLTGKNRYLIIGDKLKFSESYYTELDKCEIIRPCKKKLLEIISEHRVVIIHRLSHFLKKVVANISNPKIKVVWFCWGGDIYSEKYYFKTKDFLLPKTLKEKATINHKKNSNNTFRFLGDTLTNIIVDLIDLLPIPRLKAIDTYILIKAIRRVDYIATVVPTEIKLIQSRTKIRAKELTYSYSNLPLLLGDVYKSNPSVGNNLLIGNSATYSNNHLDILDRIKTMDLGMQIIVPLSYGDSQRYVETIIKVGSEMFGDIFEPITEFMSRKDYNEKLKSCGHMILNNIRQEAVGNIIIGLYLGMKVYLNDNSPVYAFLVEKGFKVYSFDREFSDHFQSNLSLENCFHNRELLEDFWGEESTIDKILNTHNQLKSFLND